MLIAAKQVNLSLRHGHCNISAFGYAAFGMLQAAVFGSYREAYEFGSLALALNERFGNVSFLHMTDCHAQLKPIHFREPSVNLGIGSMLGQPPHLVGKAFLERYGIRPDGSHELDLVIADPVLAGRLGLARAEVAGAIVVHSVSGPPPIHRAVEGLLKAPGRLDRR